MFAGQERLFEEQRIIQQAVSEPVPEYMLEYMRDHPAFRADKFPRRIFDYQRNHPAFEDTEYLFGQIIYEV